MDHSTPGSSVQEILQARVLEQVVISFSRESSWPRDWAHISCIGRKNLYYWVTVCACCCFSRVRLCVIPWTVACQAPLSMEFSRQEYGRILVAMPFSRGSSQPRDRTCISSSPALAGVFSTTSTTWAAPRGSPIHGYCLKNTCLISSVYL